MTVEEKNEPEEVATAPAAAPELSEISVSADKPARKKKTIKSAPGQVVSNDPTDLVSVSLLSIDSPRKKSLSVHHLQRRLVDVGYDTAAADVDGRFGPVTEDALGQWLEANGYTSLTLEAAVELFDGDPNVNVAP